MYHANIRSVRSVDVAFIEPPKPSPGASEKRLEGTSTLKRAGPMRELGSMIEMSGWKVGKKNWRYVSAIVPHVRFLARATACTGNVVIPGIISPR